MVKRRTRSEMVKRRLPEFPAEKISLAL